MDIEEEQCKGVYLMIYKNVLLYSKENQVEIDFLEQMLCACAGDGDWTKG